MRKSVLTLILALAGSAIMAQVCTPNPLYVLAGIPGIYPNPLIQSNLASGNQGQAYTETFTIMVPQDTTIDLSALIGFPFPPVTVSVNFQEVTAITGLPAGLNYTCDIQSCNWGGGTNGCIQVAGTPTQGGTFNVGMTTGYNVTVPQQVPVLGGQSVTVPIPGLGWTMDVTAVGVQEQRENSLWISHNAPNPFHGTTTITYHAPRPSEVTMTVTDLLGKVVSVSSSRATVGDNAITFDANGFTPGIYLYTLSNGSQAATGKMVIE